MSTKLGLHITFGSRNGYGEVAAAVPAAVTAVGEGGALVEAKEKTNGRTITIYREHTVFKDAPSGIDHITVEEARQAADHYWPKLKIVYRKNPADYYQVTNETGGDNPKSLANVAAFETRLMELAEEDGFKLAVASAAGGSPGNWDNWVEYFVPLIRRAGEGGHIYSRHAYGGVEKDSSGLLTTENGSIQPADANAGRPFQEASYLRSQGITTPIILTEVGQNGGYKFPGKDAFMKDIERYDILCQEHENIWAFCIWTYGNYQNRPANIEVASGELEQYLRRHMGAVRPTYPTNENNTTASASTLSAAGSRSSVALEFGIHNEDGADWMLANGVKGWGLHTIALGPNGTRLDLTRFAHAGIKMLIRLNYGYGTTGNIPLPTNHDYQHFIRACVQTMQESKGVWGFILGNETNNPNEWPGGPGGTPISAQEYVNLYNKIWNQKPDHARLGPQAVDPYFGPGSDNRVYWKTIMQGVNGADLLTVHPKTQDGNPDNVDSNAKFSDDPLRWQYLHLRSYKPLLETIPSRFSQLPIIATEVNPQRKNGGKELGWEPSQGAEWVRRAVKHFQQYNATSRQPITGVVFYRFSADEWAIHNRPDILASIQKAASS